MRTINSKTVNLIGFPIDLGADRKGVDMGRSALRIDGLTERLKKLGYKIIDEGNISIQIRERQKVKNPKLKYIDEILKTSVILAQKVEKALSLNQFPLCIGGDHSMGIGTIAAFPHTVEKIT